MLDKRQNKKDELFIYLSIVAANSKDFEFKKLNLQANASKSNKNNNQR